VSLAVYPGSFDPLTLGHLDIIQRVSKVFDKLIVLVSHSSKKTYIFSAAERRTLIEKALTHIKNVEVQTHVGLTTEFLKKVHAQVMVRGVRSANDFENEIVIAQMNKRLAPDIETLVLFPNAEFQFIASSAIKEIAQFGGDLKAFVPPNVSQALKEKLHVIRQN